MPDSLAGFTNMAAAHILVVDDDQQTLEMVGMLLKRLGYQVSEANDGQQALAHAAANTPDLIVLDLMMPGIDGYTVARRLRAQAATAHTPIIMFTAKGMVDDMAAGFEAGVDDYLTKPIDPAEMSEHIALALARHSGAGDAAQTAGRMVACIGATADVVLAAVCVNTAAAMAGAGHTALVAGWAQPDRQFSLTRQAAPRCARSMRPVSQRSRPARRWRKRIAARTCCGSQGCRGSQQQPHLRGCPT